MLVHPSHRLNDEGEMWWDALNRLGKEGWENYLRYQTGDTIQYCFKRPYTTGDSVTLSEALRISG